MKLFKFRHIRTRLTIWFLVIALTPLSTAILITYQQRVAVIESRTLEKLVAIRDLKVARLQDWLQERKADMQMISQGHELENLELLTEKDDLMLNDTQLLHNLRGHLRHFLKKNSAYLELFIIHPETGVVLVSSNRRMEGVDQSREAIYIHTKTSEKFFIRDIYFSKILLNHTMDFSMPIFHPEQHHILGILVAHMDINHSLYPILQDRVGLGETGETLIVNSDVVPLNILRWQDKIEPKTSLEAKPALYASQGRTGVLLAADYRGEEVLAAYTYIPDTGWGFVSKQDLYELRQPIREMSENFAMLFFISSIFIALAAFFVAKTISKPVVDMEMMAKKIMAGNYSDRVRVHTEDELGSLGTSINHMVEKIGDWHQSLKETVKKRTEELEKKNSELERFSYTVSHDLKSPLVTIRGFVGFLEKDVLNGDKKRIATDLQHINEASNTMQSLLDELLEFSRVGRLKNSPEKFSMQQLVNETVSLLSGGIMQGHVVVDVQPDLPEIFADRPRIREVVQNLIENAVKFMGEQNSPHIEIGWYAQNNDVVYCIKDNGIGIHDLYHKKIFGMFERLSTDVDGTGMGLALVKRIIETHGGRIWLESEGENEGCTFCFTIPHAGDNSGMERV